MLSLETCQKLKAAGWEQNLEGWHYFDGQDTPYYSFDPLTTGMRECDYVPTLEELLEAIQAHIGGELGETKLTYCVNTDKWEAYAYPHNYLTEEKTIFTIADDPSEAAAALWLKLRDLDA